MQDLTSQLKAQKKDDDLEYHMNTIGNRVGRMTKRVFDFVFALIALIILSPLFLLISILIKRDSPGPIFYWGPRIGRNAAIFKMLKFRTMYETTKSYSGLRITGMEDERITPLGKWLRDTKLNELPQLWNVLKGEMSLVGPRPEDPLIFKTWPVKIARELLSVRPGLTSPASVVYRDEESMLHAGDVMRKYLHELSPDKMRLDQLYIRYRSIWLDLDVIFWTALLLIPKIKAYSPPEQFLFVGPITRLIQRYVSWFLWDFLIMWVSISLMSLIVGFFGPTVVGPILALQMALAFSILNNMTGVVLRTNQVNWTKANSWELSRLWMSWLVITVAILILHNYLGFANLRTYGLILLTSIIALPGILFARYRGRLTTGFWNQITSRQPNIQATRERVLIVGSGRTAEHISWLLDHPTYSRRFQIAGFIDNDLLSQGMKIYGSKVIGMVDQIQQIVKDHDIGLIILADNKIASGNYKGFRNLASFYPAKVVVVPDIFGSLNELDGGLPINQSGDFSDDFQCQNCLARYKSHLGQTNPVSTKETREIPG